jgi:outer membrane immunogenic protein
MGGSFNSVNLSGNNSGFVGGAQVGYNWQFVPNFVLGVEGMLDGTAIRGSSNTVAVFGPYGLAFLQGNANTNWVSTLSARFGYAANNWLFYGKAGGGWVGSSVTVTDATSGASFSKSNTNSAWLIGAGIEYGLTDHLTIKVEYDHLGLTDWTASRSDFLFPNDSVTLSRQIDMVTVGGNYKF